MVIRTIKFVLTNLYRSRYSKSMMIQVNLDRELQGEKEKRDEGVTFDLIFN